jgi:high-affinity nickel-transport protein
VEGAVLALTLGGSLSVLGGALALGLRHGIDWDHIAAITDITSTTAASEPSEGWLTDEPGVLLTDESDHVAAALARRRPVAGGQAAAAIAAPSTPVHVPSSLSASQRRAVFLASLYALGHGTMVTVLGLLAITASEFLPAWIDPVMERVVGVTLLLLAVYLFYSLFGYFRSGGEIRIRSRWMLIFAGARNGWHWLWSRLAGEHEHPHVHQGVDQYGPKTAYTVGLIHGVGAETGTQVLIIATAVGAGTQAMGVAALLFFVLGLLISNSFVTVATAAGFVSARRRQLVYVLAGLLAAVFSLAVGLFFLVQAGGLLPDLGHYFRWLGGPDA